VEYRLLGSLEVLHEGGLPVRLGGLKPRLLLAVLLVHANHVVTVDELVDALWGEDPPATARKTVQYFVHGLRKTLGGAVGDGKDLVATQASGYLLHVEPDALDVQRFEAALRRAWQAEAGGDLRTVAAALTEGLAEWRGPALADFTAEPSLQPVIAQLEEQRLAATEELAEARLALGEHAELVGELEALRRSAPLRERAHELLMIALYRSGRQAEALTLYRRFRDRLVEELGLEPGPELRRLEARMLAQDPTLAVPASPALREPPATQDRPLDTAPGQADTATGPAPVREERRTITALVAGMAAPGGEASDPEDERARSGRAMERPLEAISLYGGTVMTVFGGTVLAVFGIPKAREDDPERAVRAALAICSSPPDGMTIRVGVDTGEAVVAPRLGWGGTAGDRQLALAGGVSGLVLDAAVRLQLQLGTPAGGVLVGEAAYRATQRRIVYADGGPPWRPVRPRSRSGMAADDGPGRRSPLVERRHELMVLASMLGRVRQERVPQLVTVVGAPGIGKTRLVAELARRAEKDPDLITWRVGRSPAYGRREDGSESGVVFWALAEIIRAQVGIDGADSRQAAEAKLQAAVAGLFDDPADATAVAGQLRRLLHLGPAGDPDPDADQRHAAFSAWGRFLSAVAEGRPLVLVFEDVHWASDALLLFIDELADWVGPVPLLVVCTGRPELLEGQAQWGGGKPNAATISLGPLSQAGAAALLDSLLAAEGTSLEAATREQLLDAAGGNPLFLEEYVRMLGDRSIEGALPVPETVQQLITARIDQLEDPHRVLLHDMAVIGEPGWTGSLAALSALPPEELSEGLAHLARQELLRRVRTGPAGEEPAYVFWHPIIREVAYGQLVRAERAEKHRRVAAWLEDHDTGPVTEHTELLAHHYEQALALTGALGQPTEELADRARVAFRAAGDRAASVGAPATAARYYQQALQLCPAHDPDRPELLFALGRARTYSDHAGQDLLLPARDAFAAAGRSDRVAEVEMLMALNALTHGNIVQADRHLTSVLSRDAPASPSFAVALAQGVMGFAITDQYSRALELVDRALDMAEQVDRPDARAHALTGRGLALLKSGRAEGVADLEQAVALLAAQKHPNVHYARWDLAWGLLLHGDLDQCARIVHDGCQAAMAARAATARWFDHIAAVLDYHRGNWQKALDVLMPALDRRPDPQDGYLRPWQHLVAAQIHAGRGRLDRARELAVAARNLAEQTGNLRDQQSALGLVGWLELTAGWREHAADQLERLQSLQRRVAGAAVAPPEQGLLLVALDLPADRLPALAPTGWHLAVAALAKRDFAGATECYGRIGTPVEQARVRLAAARWLTEHDRPDDALSELDQAIPVLKHAGASGWLSAARTLRSRLALATS
jgi:DNA-binding SARP family transcriptional activator/tetratricopeptide (TPR) repeat protein